MSSWLQSSSRISPPKPVRRRPAIRRLCHSSPSMRVWDRGSTGLLGTACFLLRPSSTPHASPRPEWSACSRKRGQRPHKTASCSMPSISVETPVTPDRIAAVNAIIGSYIRRTPTIALDGVEIGIPGARVTLKLELLQHAGSFKTRGAFTHLLTRDIPPAGVAAASGGNHGAAVAYAAMTRGVPARIFVPTVSSPAKIQRIRDYGADLWI